MEIVEVIIVVLRKDGLVVAFDLSDTDALDESIYYMDIRQHDLCTAYEHSEHDVTIRMADAHKTKM